MVNKSKKRLLAVLSVVGLAFIIWLYQLLSVEFITNKGPDDLGAQTFAEKYLNDKYGKHDGTMCINIINFEPKESDKNEGIYSINCTYNGVSTTIHAYYNGKEFGTGSDTPK